MRRQTTDGGIIEQTLIEPVAVRGDEEPHTDEARPAPSPCGRRTGVLVVIAAEAARTELSLRLGASGYDVWAATTGRAAVELAEQMPLDVIVLDLDEMYEISPGQVVISGFRLLHLLGRLTRERPVAVVVMSSMDFAEVEGPVRASADDFVNKPIEAAQFIRRLQGALDRARTRHQQRVPVASPAWQAG